MKKIFSKTKLFLVNNFRKIVVLLLLFYFGNGSLNLYNNVWKVPENTQKTNILISNDVTGLNKTEHSEVFIPKDENELSEILKNTKGKIAIAGSKKSMGGQSAIYAGVQISTENFNKILDYSTTTKEITVQSGVRWFEIQNHIDKDNLSVMIMQSYNNFSVGGAISTNVHGRYIGYGPIIESVKSFRIILSDGKKINASREENSEIFYGAIGGFGALGVITDITFKLADNVNIERKVEKVALKDYVKYFKENIESDRKVIFQNGDIYLDDYNTINSVSYKETEKELTEKERLMSKENLENNNAKINRLAWYLMSEFWFGEYLRKYVLDPYMFEGERVVTRNFEASYDVSDLEPSSRKEKTYVLQEYFIPVDKFEEFVPKMKNVFEKYNVNVLNISIRHAKKDEGSLMAWAPDDDVFAFVVYYKQGTDEYERNIVRKWTQEITEEIANVGGKYYLPYQSYATYEQFTKIYNNYENFFELKKKLDPDFRFSNTMWEKYYIEYIDVKKNNEAKSAKLILPQVSKDEFPKYFERKYEQTFLTLPEWHMVYSFNEFADFLESGGAQQNFPFWKNIKKFWQYYNVAKQEIGNVENSQYQTMIYVIGASFSIEYGFKFIYENTIGRFTDFINGHETEADKYIANSWKDFGEFINQTPWYEYHYFSDIKNIWTKTSFFERGFVRSLERKISLTIGYGLKGIYAKLIGFLSQSKYGVQENITLSLVKTDDIQDLENLQKENILKVLKNYNDNIYLIQTERYKGFKDAFLKIVNSGKIEFLEIQGNKKIMITYLSSRESEPFVYTDDIKLLDKEELFYNKDSYKYRIVLNVDISKLKKLLDILKKDNSKFEMIYDF